MSTPLPTSVLSHPVASQWINFNPKAEVIVFSGKVELGQGISAALIQTVCWELGFGSEQVVLIAGDTGQSPDEGYTAGSQSVEVGVAALKHVCRLIRSEYASVAAKTLNCSTSELTLSNGEFKSASGQRLSFHQISADANLQNLRLDDSNLKILDHPLPERIDVDRIDLLKKFTSAGYIHDIDLPELWHARIVRGPHPHCRPQNLNHQALESLVGVDKVFVKNDFIALIGKDEEQLIQAQIKAQKEITWTKPPALVYDSVEELLIHQNKHSTVVVGEGIGEVKREGQESESSDKHGSSKSLTQRYSRPYIAHASIGLACAVAQPSSDGTHLTLWSHSQGVFKLREQICKALDLDPKQVRIKHSPGAGCYGHNGADDVVFDAAFIAHSLNITVRVVWSRADELTHSPMGSASLVELSAKISNLGEISNWNAQVWSNTHLSRPGWGDGVQLMGYWSAFGDALKPTPKDVPLPTGGGLRNIIPPYNMDALRVEHHFIAQSPVRVSALRSLGAHANVFAIESFMDELAEQIQMDPVKLRLKNLKSDRAKAVVQKVSEMSNWNTRGDAGNSIGLGLAYSQYKNHAGHCAIAILVEVSHKVSVQKVWACVDAGAVVHKDGLLNQIEGGIIQSLSWTLKESVRWDTHAVTSADWESYPILGFDEIPEIHIELIENTGDMSLGAGEVAAGPTAAALSNALSHALGIRFRNMPFTIENITQTIENTV